ncbi:ABC transporter substrate-binding protein [Arthrobacter sp. KBS0703]|uniref:metal ABC transporter solute-binding protein, Zn/Mn family n=1 Tax=Arthrobacter sp. KBS0703 TaxID=1955698 RepID=UPI00098FF3C2|nr:zinc ABC transporter substrate-binding protein [Arthrobacter sp. KBS0703]TSE15789.1 ABC transporter substrate-binding protein [Arthrobacter sp. KBS0703]
MQDEIHGRRRPAAFVAAAGTALMLLLAGCSSTVQASAPTGTGTVEVATSTDVYGDIVHVIGGDRVHVTPIIHSASQDPHSYQATTQDKLTVSKARILIENGGGYDDFFSTLAADNTAGDQQVINVTKLSGLAPQTGTASQGASGTPEFNEHLWYNLEAMTTFADTLSGELARVDPAGASSFAANADRFKAELGKLKDRTAALKARRGGEAVAITEPVPLYLLDAAGLVNKTPEEYSHAIEAGQDVPVPVLQKTLDLISGKAVKMLAYNDQTEGPQTKKLKDAATAAGVPVVDFTETLPEGQNYLQWMSANVDHVEKALQP